MAEQRGLPSLDVLLEMVERERAQQQAHFESLDSKAGVTLGFSGAIAALATDVDRAVAEVGVAFAVLAAVLAVLSFRPRGHPVIEVRRLRSYLPAEPSFTKLRLFDTEAYMVIEGARVNRLKASLLTALTGRARRLRRPPRDRYAGVMSADEGLSSDLPEPAPAGVQDSLHGPGWDEPVPAPPAYEPDLDLVTYLERQQPQPEVEQR